MLNIRPLTQESLPPEYARIFAFDNFTRTQKHVLAKARDVEQGSLDECIPAGSYARLHIRDVPFSVASKLSSIVKNRPVVACGLLQHESKISVLHFRYALWSLLLLALLVLLLLATWLWSTDVDCNVILIGQHLEGEKEKEKEKKVCFSTTDIPWLILIV